MTTGFLFDWMIILSSLSSTIINIVIVYFLLNIKEYLFANSCLIFITTWYIVNGVLFYRKLKNHFHILCIPLISILLPILYYHQITQSYTNQTELTSLINNTNSCKKIHFIAWTNSKMQCLHLFLTQSIMETIPCLIIQTFAVDTIYNNQHILFLLYLSIIIAIISLRPKSYLLCSEINFNSTFPMALYHKRHIMFIIHAMLYRLRIYDYTLLTPIGNIVIAKLCLCTLPFVVVLIFRNFDYIYIPPPCQSALSWIDQQCKICYFMLRIPFMIIDVMFVIIYFLGILMVSILIFELSNFQLIYWFSINYLHGRFLNSISKLKYLMPFIFIMDYRGAKAIQNQRQTHRPLFIYNPTSQNVSLFTPSYQSNQCHDCLPSIMFWQLLFQWLFVYESEYDLLHRLAAINQVLMKHSNSNYNGKLFEKWLFQTKQCDIWHYEATVSLSELKQFCSKCLKSKQSKLSICIWHQIKQDLFSGKKINIRDQDDPNACRIFCVYCKIWLNGIFAFVVLPLFIMGRLLSVFLIPMLLFLASLKPIHVQKQDDPVVGSNSGRLLLMEWVGRLYLDLNAMIDFDGNIKL